MTPLDFSIRYRSMVAGDNRANRAYGLAFTGDARLINSYAYQKTTFAADAPEEMATMMKAAERMVHDAIETLESSWTATWLPRVQAHLADWEAFDRGAASLPALLEWLERARNAPRRSGRSISYC